MLKVDTLVLGDYQTNCYIVREASCRTCAVIDPGYSPEKILRSVEKLGLSVDAVVLTHGHFDHVGGAQELVKATGCALWMSQSDFCLPDCTENALLYPLSNRNITNISFFEDCQEIIAGGLTFTVWATPGHTRGSVCFMCGDAIFSGDTLFAGSCGRTDLPGGDWFTILKSLHRLKQEPGDYTVYPGHGPATTLEREKNTNPYMR